jgi:catechol 2,3-dioxygenase-like lactoylglutathione lyase family enzyme
MSIDLGHTIIRARDKHRSARFLADILGLQVGTATPPFLPIRTGNGVTLSMS